MEKYKAVSKYIRISPRKGGLVADLIRGKSCDEARGILKFTPKKPAKYILKTLNSAIANAIDKTDGALDVMDLYVEHVSVNQGPTMKRMKPRARGRADVIKKRTSHINVRVAEKNEEKVKE